MLLIPCAQQILLETTLVAQESEHDKAIKAVNEGEILPLDRILENVNQEFDGRVLSVNLKMVLRVVSSNPLNYIFYLAQPFRFV